MTRPARACIDLHALRHNFQRVRQAAPDSRVMAIIKANAYGHGLLRVAQSLPDADAFGVVTPEEGIELRESGIDRRIVLLEGLFSPADIDLINAYRLDTVIHHDSQIGVLEQAILSRPHDVWLKVDTGMNRLGFRPEAVAQAVARLRAIEGVASLRYMTHFACADEVDNAATAVQQALFERTMDELTGERTLANSAAILAWPGTQADWVRPGIMLYGASPLDGRDAAALDLLPVMTLKSRLIGIKDCRKGETVGYGGDWECPVDMPVGVVAIGYGDGYPRHAVSGMPVLVNGARAGLVGRVSMDMICVDLRGHEHAAVGDDVVLWGNGLPIEEVASNAGTISYELLSGISGRVSIDYID